MSKFMAKCTKSIDSRFKVGRVYESDVDGRIADEAGYKGSAYGNTFDEWYGRCFWCDYDFEQVTAYQKIIIASDGTTTLARLYDGDKVVKSVEMKNAFDFTMGARIAFDRINGDEKESPSQYIHLDLFVPAAEPPKQPDKHEFKVGDKVTLKPYREVGDHFGICQGAWDELVAKGLLMVNAVSGVDRYMWVEGCHYTFMNTHFEYYTESTKQQAKSKFKSGDFVRYVGECPHCHGLTGTLCSHDDYGWHIDSISHYCLSENEFELVAPARPIVEPMKLYCIKDHAIGRRLTKGKIYEFDGKKMHYDGDKTGSSYPSYEAWKRNNPDIFSCLVPLVGRPAKIGECVLILDNAIGIASRFIGKIARTVGSNNTFTVSKVSDSSDYFSLLHREYLILDGYTPEPEYWSGKVVCVDAGKCPLITSGRVYTVKEGVITIDGGTRFPVLEALYTSVSDLNEKCAKHSGAKFIEFKGKVGE